MILEFSNTRVLRSRFLFIDFNRWTGDSLEYGGKRSATPVFFCEKVSSREKRRRTALAAAVQKVRQRCPKPAGSFVVLLKAKQHFNQETKA